MPSRVKEGTFLKPVGLEDHTGFCWETEAGIGVFSWPYRLELEVIEENGRERSVVNLLFLSDEEVDWLLKEFQRRCANAADLADVTRHIQVKKQQSRCLDERWEGWHVWNEPRGLSLDEFFEAVAKILDELGPGRFEVRDGKSPQRNIFPL